MYVCRPHNTHTCVLSWCCLVCVPFAVCADPTTHTCVLSWQHTHGIVPFAVCADPTTHTCVLSWQHMCVVMVLSCVCPICSVCRPHNTHMWCCHGNTHMRVIMVLSCVPFAVSLTSRDHATVTNPTVLAPIADELPEG